MKKEEQELQTVTDLVAFQVMAKIFLHRAANQEEAQEVEEIHEAYHASDDAAAAIAEHQSDSDLPKNRWGLTMPLAWKLSRLWHFYKRWIG